MSQGQSASGKELALYTGVPLALSLAGAWAGPYFFKGIQGGAARGVRTWMVGVAAVKALAVAPTSGPPPPAGTADTYTVPFTVALLAGSAYVSGGTITATVTGPGSATTVLGTVTVTSASAAVSSEITCSLIAGDSYTLNASFGGGSLGPGQVIAGITYLGSQASTGFSAESGASTTLILTYTGG